MKAYTDIEQSKKLAEILPIESADMTYMAIIEDYMYPQKVKEYRLTIKDECFNLKYDIPAWSLAALLDVIPKEVKIKGQMYAPCLFPITDGHWLYKLWYNSNEIIESPIALWCDNPLDACYEMIEKLKEKELI